MNKDFIPNSTQIPNNLLDFLLPKIPMAEGKCLLYICRRTYGFHKKEDEISFSQFINGIKKRNGDIIDYGTGLSRQSVASALKNLEFSGAITIKKDRRCNRYRLNLEMNIKMVVQKIDWSKKQTILCKKNRPFQAKLLDLQYTRETKSKRKKFLNWGEPVDNSSVEDKKRGLAKLKADLIKKKIMR